MRVHETTFSVHTAMRLHPKIPLAFLCLPYLRVTLVAIVLVEGAVAIRVGRYNGATTHKNGSALKIVWHGIKKGPR